jgi:hypothetical protein
MTVLMDTAAPRVVLLANALAVVRHRTGLDVLLEAGDGTLLDYAVGASASPGVVRAVMSKDLSPLRAAAAPQRVLGVVPGGAVVARQVEAQFVAIVAPVCGPDGRAWLWLLGERGGDIDVAAVQENACLVAAHLSDLRPAQHVEAILADRAPLPPGWEEQPVVVAVVRSSRPHVVVAALRAAAQAHEVPAVVGVVDGVVLALGLGGGTDWLRAADADVQRQDPSAHGAYGTTHSGPVDLPRLHRQARAAGAVSDGPLRSARGLSSRVAVERAMDAVATAEVEHEVTADLLRHDAARGSDLAATLLTWLELHGDVSAAAQELTVHVNTLRYRLRRAVALLDGDLDDAAVRLDVHLRLRRSLR